VSAVEVLWLDRPEKRNALRLGDIRSLRARIESAAAAGLVIAGRGESFCAGVDVHLFAEGTPASARELIDELGALCAAVRRSSRPVAVAVQGACLGGALELAASADFRIAAHDAYFAMPEVAMGIPSVIDAALLERHLGLSRARELILTAEPMDAAEAHRRGFVNRLADRARLLDSALELVELALRHGGEVVAAQKALFEEWLSLPYADAVERSKAALVAAFETGEPQRRGRDWVTGRRDPGDRPERASRRPRRAGSGR
jgi:enoyl-CoA hydratase